MKTKIALIISALIAFSSIAQNGINYKAIIKDAIGNVIANDLIQIQFEIRQNLVTGTVVYAEIHSPTTDDNGIIIINIGEGTPISGTFVAIDWSSMNHFLNVQVNTGGGLQDMGTTALKTVPYALNALSSSDNYWSKNGNAIYTLDRDVGINSMNPEHTFDVRVPSIEAAADLNVSNQDKSRYLRLFSGSSMFPDPSFTWAPDRSLLFASFDDNTLAFNEYMRISSIGDVGIGIADPQAKLDILGGDWNLDAGNPGDLRIGNATHNFRIGVAIGGGGAGVTRMYTNSNTLILGTNDTPRLLLEPDGSMTAPNLSNTLIEGAGDKALVTKEYVDDSAASGLEAVDEGNGVGFRLIGRDPVSYGNIGSDAVDLSYFSSSIIDEGATGDRSTAMGFGTTASGFGSTAMGSVTTASGSRSIAMGMNTVAPSYAETVIGRYNTNYNQSSQTVWSYNDRLFVIGNGTGESLRSNALTVLKNGNIGVVTATPSAKLHISQGNDTGLGDNNGYLLLGETNGTNISIDNNEIMAKNNGNAAKLNLNIEGGIVETGDDLEVGGSAKIAQNVTVGDKLYFGQFSTNIGLFSVGVLETNAFFIPYANNALYLGSSNKRWATIFSQNPLNTSSDRRLKKEIKPIDYGLSAVMKLKPVSYKWKQGNQDTKLGFIAQDVSLVVPEIVKLEKTSPKEKEHINETSPQIAKDDYYAMSYTEIIPILAKAIQEQQAIINILKKEKGLQHAQITELQQNYQSLLSRIEVIESNTSN